MSRRVVIVDDSQFIIKTLTEFFTEKMNYKVVGTGRDGNEAIALYRQHLPDLLTLDVTMPNKDGYDATRELIAEFPTANILVISALHGDYILDCLTAGAKGYIKKPLKFHEPLFVEDFQQTLSAVLGDK
jgi:two-component system chemotaxis response regulator CheY